MATRGLQEALQADCLVGSYATCQVLEVSWRGWLVGVCALCGTSACDPAAASEPASGQPNCKTFRCDHPLGLCCDKDVDPLPETTGGPKPPSPPDDEGTTTGDPPTPPDESTSTSDDSTSTSDETTGGDADGTTGLDETTGTMDTDSTGTSSDDTDTDTDTDSATDGDTDTDTDTDTGAGTDSGRG